MSSNLAAAVLVLGLAFSMTTEIYAQGEISMPLLINITVLNGQGDGNQCPSTEERERGVNEIDEQVRPILSRYTSLRQRCGDPNQGWRQVEYIDMTDNSYNCPPGLLLTSYSKRTCGREHVTWRDCSSSTFSVGGSAYSEVCGRIKAYQLGVTWGLWAYNLGGNGLDSHYVDGLSLTHRSDTSSPREHIWTFIAGLHGDSLDGEAGVSHCPCDVNYKDPLPTFMGQDYFCESVVRGDGSDHLGRTLDTRNPLWDGQYCGETGNTCCQVNNPPWFDKVLPAPTTDDIELRMCFYGHSGDTEPGTYADFGIEVLELYVK